MVSNVFWGYTKKTLGWNLLVKFIQYCKNEALAVFVKEDKTRKSFSPCQKLATLKPSEGIASNSDLKLKLGKT